MIAAAGCAGRPLPRVEGPLVELSHDEGRPDDKPTLPGRQLELLVRFEPKLVSFRLRRMRLLLAQPGRIVFSFYRALPDGGPGQLVAELERVYGPELVSAPEAADRRWVVEELGEVPGLATLGRGALVVGVAAPERGSDPRIWASGEGTGQIYERELDGSVGRFRHAPMIRIEVEPASSLGDSAATGRR